MFLFKLYFCEIWNMVVGFSFVVLSSSFKCRVEFQRKKLFGSSAYYSQRAVTREKKKKKRQSLFNLLTM